MSAKRPGEIIHMDIKKLGRFNRVGHRITGDRRRQSNQRHNGTAPGWEYVHVAIDDHSRIGFADIFPNEKKESAVAFLEAAVTYFATLGVTITRVMTDNGSCYRSKAFRDACRRLTIKHIRTQTLHASDQRQGRTLHPDNVARMGLRNRIPQLRPAKSRSAEMAAPLQTGIDPMPASIDKHQSADSA